ncbi:hypothetical protein BJY00DRAFT_40888 [Aspergillus carlsbadensis]|nr:hypothetical protein BJY00DRAFT_40888 [Aspergillus carlsbadensis]
MLLLVFEEVSWLAWNFALSRLPVNAPEIRRCCCSVYIFLLWWGGAGGGAGGGV